MPRMLTISQVAELIGCSTASVRRLERAGRIPAGVRLSYGLKRWPTATIEQWLAAQSLQTES
jgi:predicted DNA-binding transcriptional regulator AlpA